MIGEKEKEICEKERGWNSSLAKLLERYANDHITNCTEKPNQNYKIYFSFRRTLPYYTQQPTFIACMSRARWLHWNVNVPVLEWAELDYHHCWFVWYLSTKVSWCNRPYLNMGQQLVGFCSLVFSPICQLSLPTWVWMNNWHNLLLWRRIDVSLRFWEEGGI